MADVQRRVGAEQELLRLRPGLFAVGPAPDSPFAQARRDTLLARVAACEASLRSDHWYSHETAALLLGLWTYRLRDRVHLTQLGRPRIQRETESWEHRHRVVRHWTDLPERDRTWVRGVPVTTLERTAVDCARTLPFTSALMTMDCALRHGANPRLITQIVREANGRRGVVQARQVLELADPGSESHGESLVRGTLVEAGFPPPQTQVKVATSDGDKWLDLGWPDAQVGVEFDGEIKYGELAGGDPDGARRRERRRQTVVEHEGWRLARSTWPDIEEPRDFLGRVRNALVGRWDLLPDSLPYVVGGRPERATRRAK